MSAKPIALVDPVPGNRGLQGPARLLFRLDELDGVLHSDLEGNLDDLAIDVGHTNAPPAAAGWTKPLYADPNTSASSGARAFAAASSHALFAADLAGKDTLLLRDVTIMMIVALPTVVGDVPQQTFIARGLHDGTAGEPYSYGLETFAFDHVGTYGIRFFWEDSAGVIQPAAGVALPTPGAGQFFLVTATRRWESTGKVVCRYYANDVKLGETTSVHGDIAGGTTGHTSVGARKNAGAWEHFLTATIDELLVADFEMSLEEIRQVYRRLTIYQPAGVAMFTGLLPEGSDWGADPSNSIGKHVKATGQALGQAVANTEDLRALWLPDACTREIAARWEFLCGLSVGPSDSLDVRRARIIGYLSRDQGYSRPAIQGALADLLDQAAADVDILEFDQTITDDFTTLEPERWLAGDVGAWSIVAGKLHGAWNAGTDIRWEPTRAQAFIRMPMPMSDSPTPLLTGAAFFYASWKVSAWTVPANVLAGVFVYNRRSNNALWFGIYTDGGSIHHIGWANYIGGVIGAFTAIAAAPPTPTWFRIEQIPKVGFGGADVRRYRFSWSTVGATPTSSFTTHEEQFAFPDPEWIGFGAVSTLAALANNTSIDVDDFLLHTPNSDRPFYWYVFRDPLLAGAPDIVGAQGLVSKLKPSHTFARVIQSKSVIPDDPVKGLCDVGPMGAL